MTCSESLNTQAWFDSELEGDAARAAERHLESCSECAQLLRNLDYARRAIRTSATYYRADESLRARVRDMLEREGKAGQEGRRAPLARARQYWAAAASGLAMSALAAALAFLLLVPSETAEFAEDLTKVHERSLADNHLVEIASSDPGVVAPWLKERTAIAVPVAAHAMQGYRLVGARTDSVYGAKAAVAVYRHGGHVVNVFAWVQKEGGEELPATITQGAYHVVIWKKGRTVYCAMSDVAMNDLQRFAQVLKGTA